MIIDNVNNLQQYFNGSWLVELLDFYQKIDIHTSNGNYVILENDLLFCKVMTYNTKTEGFITESHREYIDFQVLLSGQERLDIYHPANLLVKKPYELETDCTFYEYPELIVPDASIYLKPELIAVLFPQDAHATQMTIGSNPSSLKKAVFKVHNSLL